MSCQQSKKITFPKNLNKMFSSAREIFINKEDNTIISEDDDDDKRKIELSIPNIQTFFQK